MELTEPVELQLIKDHNERAYECLDAGLAADEAGHKAQALALYRLGRQHFLHGLDVPTHGEAYTGATWDAARQIQLKMTETLSSITMRLVVLETASALGPAGPPTHCLYPHLPVLQEAERPAPPSLLLKGPRHGVPSLPASPKMTFGVPGDQPPAYTPQATDGHLTISYGTDKDVASLGRLQRQASAAQNLGEGGEELLFLSRGVQIFFVTADGQVSAPSYPGYLRIIMFSSQHSDSNACQPPAYLQVCDWLYPLFPDSPVLLSNTGVFTFPDTTATAPGSYVGVVLSSELPASDRTLFQEQLSLLTELRVQAPDSSAEEGAGAGTINLSEKVPMGGPTAPGTALGDEGKPLPEWSEKLAHGILAGASWLSRGLVRGAEVTGKAIHKGASKLREHITPEDIPVEVSPRVTKGLHVAKQATGGAVKVSQLLVDGVCSVAGCVGSKLAPHVKKHGSKLIPESLKKNKDGRSNLDGAMVVAASGIQGLSTMWTSLETAAKNIGKSVTSETVTTIKHKYGDEAALATVSAIQSVVNVGTAAYNMDNLGLKAVMKTTGKQTAKAVVQEHETGTPEERGEEERGEEERGEEGE